MSETHPIRIDRITQADAAHVLGVARFDGGRMPGGFMEKLIEAAFLADLDNLERLAHGFEGIVAGVSVYKRMPGGVQILQGIAAGLPYMPGQE
jgi:hypothetical protein